MSEQTMIITTYGSIGVLIAASIYVVISLIISKIKAKKQLPIHYNIKQPKNTKAGWEYSHPA